MHWIRNSLEINHSTHKSILSMEGIRGFAVFLVFLVHFCSLVNPWLVKDSMVYQFARYGHNIGNAGVDLFFVLSGYLIYGTLIEKQKRFLDYIARRIQRIYPTFTTVLILYLALSIFFPEESKLPKELNSRLIYIIQNFILLPGLFNINPIITVAWSLSYEFFYYLCLPIIIFVFSLRSWTKKSRVAFFVCLTILSFTISYYYGGPIRLVMFVAGILLYDTQIKNTSRQINYIGLISLLLSMVLMVLLQELNYSDWYRFAIIFILFYLFCFECFYSLSFSSRLFSISPLRWLGNMSYSYYLIHGLSLKFTFLILGKVYPSSGGDNFIFWLLLPLSFLITLIPSMILFITIEKPFSLQTKR